jgi:hypothetical protein
VGDSLFDERRGKPARRGLLQSSDKTTDAESWVGTGQSPGYRSAASPPDKAIVRRGGVRLVARVAGKEFSRESGQLSSFRGVARLPALTRGERLISNLVGPRKTKAGP